MCEDHCVVDIHDNEDTEEENDENIVYIMRFYIYKYTVHT